MNQQYRNIVYCSDVSGTGFWRHIQQIMNANCVQSSTGVQNTYTQQPVFDAKYYEGMTSITIQRWISDQQKDIVEKFLKPITEQQRSWLIYAIDDAMHYNDIPLFNRGRMAFANDKIQSNIKYMLNAADFVVVTTDYIKKYYHKTYDVPIENIIAVPNLLPKWWFGDRYSVRDKIRQRGKFNRKPRIGIISSLSHFNIDNIRLDKNGKACRLDKMPDGTQKWINQDKQEVKFEDTTQITDDLDDILDVIRSTVNTYQWVFLGYAPPKLQDLVQSKAIEYHPGVPILNYPSAVQNLQLQAVIAPIKDMEFNRCKSHIKYLECCALGIPLIAKNTLPYSNVMRKEDLYDDANDLKDKIYRLMHLSDDGYRDVIEYNWKWFNTPKRDGDFTIQNCWLDDNMGMWYQLFKLRPKSVVNSMRIYFEMKHKKEEEEKKNTIFSDDSGIEILK